jgi:hypothetical protein
VIAKIRTEVTARLNLWRWLRGESLARIRCSPAPTQNVANRCVPERSRGRPRADFLWCGCRSRSNCGRTPLTRACILALIYSLSIRIDAGTHRFMPRRLQCVRVRCGMDIPENNKNDFPPSLTSLQIRRSRTHLTRCTQSFPAITLRSCLSKLLSP